MSTKVKVAVRVRPLNKREIDCVSDVVIDMKGDQTLLKARKGDKKAPKSFTFDHCFWSMDASDPKFASQDYVYECLGTDVLENAFNGYNACIFAYGQTGSGKSYTMMGSSGSKGLIPKICDSLFEKILQLTTEHMSYKVEVSYMEIYNEKVRDLLCPKSDKHNLKVREHAALGPYVDGLSKLLVSSYSDIENLMVEGNKSRTVAATNMNAESSRSHAVFSVVMTQNQYDEVTNATGEKVSKLSLVDLAGSERVSKTCASGDRLKEGGNINKSLTTLGLVISALADASSGKISKKKNFIPYRDSVLTWLLKDNLGGNSKTVMVATVSPASENYEETMSTLRYADRAKRIENHAVVNEDPNAKIIRELREEVDKLKAQLIGRGLMSQDGHIREQLVESEKLMEEASLTWEEKEKQTEQIHQERHTILEKMGISVQDTGIAVEKGRYYLVNLNADPSLNEMLVYYLKDHTKVGRPDASTPQDIQLKGLGILSDHCIIDIEDTAYLEPLEGARTCVNGQVVTDRTQLRHGDRILWGNNHFFRINCPHSQPPPGTPEEKIDFDFAQNELLLNEFDSLNEPIQVIIQQLEEHHEKEKQGALDQQKEMYEQKLEELRREITPDSLVNGRTSSGYGTGSGYGTSSSFASDDRLLNTPFYDSQLLYEENLHRLKEEVIKANVLVREANQISSEMSKEAEFAVTLQIPTASLSQAMNRGLLTSEVAVVVKQKMRGTQVWSVDKLGNKIYDMRDAYQTFIQEGSSLQNGDTKTEIDDNGLFFEVECHTLVGVATVWLECLYQNVPLDYSAPIISQQGEVCGRLSVEITRLQEEHQTPPPDDASFSDDDDDNGGLALGSTVQVQITIKEAQGLPHSLCNYVFGQYTFFDEDLVVVPSQDVATPPEQAAKTNSMLFNSTKVFNIEVDEEFLDFITDGSLPIEIYGNRSRGFEQKPNLLNAPNKNEENEKTLLERWKELSRQLEVWVEIHELNEQGFYSPVELLQREGQEAGGVFMLRQGFSRRLVIQCVVPKHDGSKGSLPVVVESITNIAVGSVTTRSKLQKGLDSYQERDLQMLRDRFSNSVMKRREFLDQQIQEMINKPNKTQTDKEHEGMLIDQWVSLTEERNAILCPSSGSGVPGATIEWNPLPGMENHIPVIFLDLDDIALNGCPDINSEPAGHHAFLSFEQSDSIIGLPILKYDQKRVTATASWDSSIHDSVYLNRITPANERVYIILKLSIRLSSPALVNVVLRKRICLRMYKRPSLKDSLRKKFWQQTNVPTRCGVTFELISHIPCQSGELTEERESLAQKAAKAMHSVVVDGEEVVDENAIEKYNKGISHVENILNLHKLRQEVLVKEKLADVGRSSKSIQSRNLRKFASTPNLFNLNESANGELSPSPNAESATKRVDPPRSRQSLGPEGPRQSSGPEGLKNKRTLKGHHRNDSYQNNSGVDNSPAGERTRLHPGSPLLHDRHVKPNGSSSASPVSEIRDQTGDSARKCLDEQFVQCNNESATVQKSDDDNPTVSPSNLPDVSAECESLQVVDNDSPTVSLSSLPNDLVEQANLERDRELRKEKIKPTMSLPLDEQGVSDEISTNETEEQTEVSQPPLSVGDVVRLSEKVEGQVRFYGRTKFSDGVWVGIALSVPEGKNDGSVNGVSYFNCEPFHGIFIRADKLSKM